MNRSIRYGMLIVAVIGLAGLAGCNRSGGVDGGSLPEIASAEAFAQKLSESERPVVVEFYTDWCGWCKKLEPELAKLADEYDGRVDFVKVNSETVPELARKYEVRGVPAVFVIRGGRTVKSLPGYRAAEQYRPILDKLLAGS